VYYFSDSVEFQHKRELLLQHYWHISWLAL